MYELTTIPTVSKIEYMTKSNGDKTDKDPKTGQFTEGNTLGKGRPPGSRNWETVLKDALKKIAEANNKTPEELETMLHEVGINKALKGDYRFWSELQKRQYGETKKEVHITTDEEPSPELQKLAEAINED